MIKYSTKKTKFLGMNARATPIKLEHVMLHHSLVTTNVTLRTWISIFPIDLKISSLETVFN